MSTPWHTSIRSLSNAMPRIRRCEGAAIVCKSRQLIEAPIVFLMLGEGGRGDKFDRAPNGKTHLYHMVCENLCELFIHVSSFLFLRSKQLIVDPHAPSVCDHIFCKYGVFMPSYFLGIF